MTGPSVTPRQFLLPLAKVDKYLLDEHHPQGGPKARFLMRFGFVPADPAPLMHALLEHPTTGRFAGEALTPLGQTKVFYEGPLTSPDGRSPNVRTVWRIRADQVAEFVTLVPIKP